MNISVYIPNYNDAQTLPRAIESAVSQPAVCEVVVIDDCSEDGSVEVCERFERSHPDKFRFVRHPQKSRCWEEAAAAIFPTLRGTHVVSVGADDFLLPGHSEAFSKYGDKPIVFCGYVVVKPVTGEALFAARVAEKDESLSPEEVIASVSDTSLTQRETGIGSAIRKDCLEWLCGLRYWESGPWCDSVGYGAVAVKYGATYLHAALAGFEHDENGYGGRERKGKRNVEYAKAAFEFLMKSGVDFDVAVALLAKRGINIET